MNSNNKKHLLQLVEQHAESCQNLGFNLHDMYMEGFEMGLTIAAQIMKTTNEVMYETLTNFKEGL